MRSTWLLVLLAACSSKAAMMSGDAQPSPDAAVPDAPVTPTPDGPGLAGKACPSQLTEVARITGANLQPDDRGFYGVTYKQGLYTRDATNDGKADVLSVEYVSSSDYQYKIRLFVQGANGFAAPVESTVQFPAYGPDLNFVGDINGDGLLDVLFGYSTETPDREPYLYVAMQNADHTFTLQSSVGLSACKFSDDERRFAITVVDVDRDGKDDVLATVSYNGLGAAPEGLTLLRGGANGLGSAQCVASASVMNAGYPSGLVSVDGLLAADYDNDGDLDMVAETYDEKLQFYRNTGAQTFAAVGSTTPAPSWRVLFATPHGLLNADIGTSDTKITRYTVSDTGVTSDDAGSLAEPGDGYGNLRGVVPGDFNGDGLADILVAGENDNSFAVACDRTAMWEHVGGGFTGASTNLRAIDVDGDGTTEILSNEGADAVIYSLR